MNHQHGAVSISALSSSGPLSRSTTKVAADYTVDTNDFTIRGDAALAPITISLPTAASVTGRILNVKKIDATANTVTIQASGAELIDGANTRVISVQYDSTSLQSNGASWDII